jgi:hypothetical protein
MWKEATVALVNSTSIIRTVQILSHNYKPMIPRACQLSIPWFRAKKDLSIAMEMSSVWSIQVECSETMMNLRVPTVLILHVTCSRPTSLFNED